MGQQELFYETWSDVLRATVDFLGGPKVVGNMLWPEKGPSEAHRLLLDCLNPERNHQLGSDKERLLVRLARAKGNHLPATWWCEDTGYAKPTPVNPEDKEAELMREFIRAAETVESIAKRIDRTRIKAVG